MAQEQRVIGGRNEPRCGSIGDVAQPIFTELGGLGPTGDNTWPTAVSDDGRTVIGVSRVTPAEPHAFRWTEADGMVDQATAGTVLIDSLAINCDASVMVFTSASSQRMVWTQSEGLRPLLGCQGLPLVGIEGMNQTGDVLVGECQHPDPSFATFPARWLDFEQPGMPLPGLTGWATDISADGKVFAGITQDFLVFRWSEGHGTELISAPDVFGQRLSGDGRCVFTTDFPDSDRPFRWCEGEITPIPVPPGSQTGPFFANYDGSLAIVGQGQDYWVWHEGDEAATLLLDALAESGVDLKGWDTLSVSDMTPDGRVLVGVARHSLDPTHTAAFRLVMPPW